jgi:hypothetical protein
MAPNQMQGSKKPAFELFSNLKACYITVWPQMANNMVKLTRLSKLFLISLIAFQVIGDGCKSMFW